jgi:hypothetical protein
VLLVDEAAQVDDDLLLGAAIPTTARDPGVHIDVLLILEMDTEKLDRASQALETHVTVLVASLDERSSSGSPRG